MLRRVSLLVALASCFVFRAARADEVVFKNDKFANGMGSLDFGAGLVKIPEMLHEMHTGEAHLGWGALLAGFVVSAVVGVVVIRWMLDYLRRRTYAVFAIYRLLAAAAIVALWFARS